MMLTFLDVALGLALLFATLSVFCSSLLEAWSSWTGMRGNFLRGALFRIAGDLTLYRRLIHHHAIASAFAQRPGLGKAPSYLTAERFVAALLDVVPTRARAMGMPTAYAPAIPPGLDAQARELYGSAAWLDYQGLAIGHALMGLASRSGGSPESLRFALAGWYDSQMERCSGWYKRRAQRMLFVIGVLVAAGLNIDTLVATQQLVRQPALRAWALDNARTAAAADAASGVETARRLAEEARERELPIGFDCLNKPKQRFGEVLIDCKANQAGLAYSDWLLKIVGLLLTGLAVSFGAPFWFDLLTRLANLRNTGTPEGDKKR